MALKEIVVGQKFIYFLIVNAYVDLLHFFFVFTNDSLFNSPFHMLFF